MESSLLNSYIYAKTSHLQGTEALCNAKQEFKKVITTGKMTDMARSDIICRSSINYDSKTMRRQERLTWFLKPGTRALHKANFAE